ncbi:MAG: DM13 domain-containing protein [Chitinophagaceae bacterium]|nr:DM13 domain-containing protein [Chitinophagaceae bacterium]
MKSIIVTCLIFFGLFTSCKKASTETINDLISVNDTTAILKYQGSFVNGPSGSVSGEAKIFNKSGNYILALENFKTSNGPDLKVYLSKAATPESFIKLGDLQSTNGNQLYNIPGTPDFQQYKYALIHCEKFNHLFGSAALIRL